MLRRFGSLVWRQSRDISVYNYSKTMVYEIFTNQGYLYLIQDKEKDTIEAINGSFECYKSLDFPKPTEKQSSQVFLPREK